MRAQPEVFSARWALLNSRATLPSTCHRYDHQERLTPKEAMVHPYLAPVGAGALLQLLTAEHQVAALAVLSTCTCVLLAKRCKAKRSS